MSAGLPALDESDQRTNDIALGLWVRDLRIVLIDAGHEAHAGLDARSYEAALARVAWHEWGHALSVDRATPSDVAAGARLLDKAPEGIAMIIRSGGYRSRELTHELVAEIYAVLMARRRRGQIRKPEWLADEYGS